MTHPWSALLETATAQSAQDSETQLYPILDQQIVQVNGPDSAKFMQGQFSCNLSEINGEQFRRGACCNAKGRMITSFSAAQHGDNYLLAMDPELVEPTLSHLKKYMVFFKTQMTATNWVMAGLKGPDADTVIERLFNQVPAEAYQQANSEHGLAIKLPFNAGYELWIKPDEADNLFTELMASCSVATNEMWRRNLIEHGLAQLTAHNQESLIPQMMNLGVTGGISFNKGCYTGQEIVARMQYLGKLKRHGYVFSSTASDIPAGSEVFTHDKSSAIGEVVNVAPSEQGCVLFAVVEDKYLENDLTVQNHDGPAIELLSLPYDPIDSSS
jgi:folate-binding protein YgfZ